VDIPQLNSRPGAQDVLYLDFDGETVTDTYWNEQYTKGGPIVVRPANLTAYEIEQIWKSAGEAFSPFNVNVTTSLAVYRSASADRRMRCIITPTQSWYAEKEEDEVGGVAHFNSFGNTHDHGSIYTCWVFNTSMKTAAMAVTHELGHTLGLRHHGGGANSSGEYNQGHGSGPLSWGPIMGAPYRMNVVQWSRGEYENANNSEQDDLALIISGTDVAGDPKGALTFASDGIGGTLPTATLLNKKTGPSTWSTASTVVITGTSDINYHKFVVPSDKPFYTASIDAILTDYMPTLKIDLELLDGTGSHHKYADPTEFPRMDASISTTLYASQTYFIKAWGAGYGDPRTDGFSAYGSVGRYTLSVNLAVPPDGSPAIATPLGNITALAGQTALLKAIVNSSPAAAIKWQVSTDGGGTWVDLTEGESYSGTQTDTLAIKNVSPEMDGLLYRFEASNPVGNIFSNSSRLIIDRTPLPYPTGLACDLDGNLYVTDGILHTVQKIELVAGKDSAKISTLAGWPRLSGTAAGPGTTARFDSPAAIAHDRFTNSLLVADAGNNVIRKVALANENTVTVFSGTMHQLPATGMTAPLYDSPAGIAVSSVNGDSYVADEAAQLVFEITTSGTGYMLAGSLYDPGSTGRLLYMPSGIAEDDIFNVYVADSGNHTIRIISGMPVTLAGSPGDSGAANGIGAAARFNNPRGLCAFGDYVYVADTDNSTIRRINSLTAEVVTIAGVAGVTGTANGTGTTALFSGPEALAVSNDGYLLVADSGNGLIRKINLRDGLHTVTTLDLVTSATVYPPPGIGGSTGGGNNNNNGNASPGNGQTTSSGGGAPSAWLLPALAALAALRLRRREAGHPQA
jgi:hypothetical protein